MKDSKPGAYPSPGMLRLREEVERRGIRPHRDSVLIARSSDVGIWHTEKRASDDAPQWRPPFGNGRALYRGFDLETLRTVLETGLDVPPQSAFFATNSAGKAWEYPIGRSVPAMLVLDGELAERSFIANRFGADAAFTWDEATYPNQYTDGAWQIHTRFEVGRGTRTFLDEDMYGYWIPGDAREALLGVVIGGPQSLVLQLIQELQADTDVVAEDIAV